LLGIQTACFLNDGTVETFGLVLGMLAIAFGVAAFVGADLSVLPNLLILIGPSIALPSTLGGEGLHTGR
jgi:hypothetical protein